MKIRYILYVFLALLISSCEGDSGIEFPEPQLKVLESDVIFETQGGAGFIKVESPGTVSAKSNSDWCKSTVSGNTISLIADANTSIVGRTATITIESGGEKIEVTAVQTASVMWLKDFRESTIAFLSEGSSVESEVVSSYPIVVESKPDWISYEFDDGKLKLTATPSIPRKGTIVFSSEGRTVKYDIIQVSYAGLLGEWEMEYNNPSQSNRLETATVVLEEKEKNTSFWLKELIITGTTKAEIHISFNPTSNSIIMSAGQYLMTASDGRTVFLSLRSAAGTYSYSTNSQLLGKLDIAEDGSVTYKLEENGTWVGAAGFGFYLFTGETPTSATATGSSYRRLMNVVMTKK